MTKRYQVCFEPMHLIVSVDEGETLYQAARAHALLPQAFCGGNGTCGKCGVTVTERGVSRQALACRTRVTGDMTVLLAAPEQTSVLVSGTARPIALTPRAGYAAAFDIGTTTIVCYLLDGATRRQLAVRGMLNPQSSFGADVILRANYALTHGGEALQSAVVGAMNQLLSDCCAIANAAITDVSFCAVVGNTAMQHLLLGVSPKPLVLAPYQPLSTEGVNTTARALGLALAPDARVVILPLISGFVGADTVGCRLATDFPALAGNTLLMDIGTNGQLVLGNATRRIACSTAAGPAFEGAKILCGMRGAPGAIDHVALENGALTYSVIGGGRPRGLCGSGLVDLVACLLSVGAILPGGRMREAEAFPDRLITLDDGARAFVLVPASESDTGAPILLSQRDVRELQLAKGAMAAGIALMADALGFTPEAIDRVLLAGAFGSYLDRDSACAVGLIPFSLRDRVETVGNAAGEGAKRAAVSDAEVAKAAVLARETEYLELASLPAFQDAFIAALAFPDEEA